ncbi:hypothetical protein CBS470a_013680 [Colletotrichum nupharicola]|nr:hypothetical protein CBS470a_013680 [Colletotrichum nupharicola]
MLVGIGSYVANSQTQPTHSYEGQRSSDFEMSIKTNITLYTEGTPNGLKPTILPAELDLEYNLFLILLNANEQITWEAVSELDLRGE